MKQPIANGDGGGQAFLAAGGLAACTSVIEGAFGLGATAIQTDAYVKVSDSNNKAAVSIHDSDNSARVRIAEIWSQHSREIVIGILFVFVIVALLIYLKDTQHHHYHH